NCGARNSWQIACVHHCGFRRGCKPGQLDTRSAASERIRYTRGTWPLWRVYARDLRLPDLHSALVTPHGSVDVLAAILTHTDHLIKRVWLHQIVCAVFFVIEVPEVPIGV